MSKDSNQVHVTLRVPPEVLEDIEAYRLQLETMMKQRQTRADALRSLIVHGLESVSAKR